MPPLLRWLLALPLLAVLAACAQEPAVGLPKLKIDAARVAVAGLSAGAYMATQTHLAWPETFGGAALVAGGPYGCADGSLKTALGPCMVGPVPDMTTLAARVRQRARAGQLGPLAALAGDHVLVLHGQQDQRVAADVSQAAAKLYETLRADDAALAGLEVRYDGNRAFGHNLPIAAPGDDCATSVPPFLGHCGFDAAGAIFAALFGPPPRPATAAAGTPSSSESVAGAPPPATATGELRAFDQDALLGTVKDAFLADTGYVYAPKACLAGQACGVLVVFHGCRQNAAAVGDTFVRDAGFNRWADAYRVAVLYPQTRASYAPLNPQACWDWWGYSDANYDTRSGVQQQWLRHALQALGVP